MTRSLLLATPVLALACAGSGADEERPFGSTDAERVALEAAIADLDDVRAHLPADDAELEALAVEFTTASRPDVTCTILGVVSGVWYDEEPVFEGAWFELGSGDLGGTIEGAYADGRFAGRASGEDVEATVVGDYEDGVFIGTWETEGGRDGQLVGRYERRNALGGYFFGLWGDCTR